MEDCERGTDIQERQQEDSWQLQTDFAHLHKLQNNGEHSER
jgi:hypothetical protein